jgi:hypothetical protein
MLLVDEDVAQREKRTIYRREYKYNACSTPRAYSRGNLVGQPSVAIPSSLARTRTVTSTIVSAQDRVGALWLEIPRAGRSGLTARVHDPGAATCIVIIIVGDAPFVEGAALHFYTIQILSVIIMILNKATPYDYPPLQPCLARVAAIYPLPGNIMQCFRSD